MPRFIAGTLRKPPPTPSRPDSVPARNETDDPTPRRLVADHRGAVPVVVRPGQAPGNLVPRRPRAGVAPAVAALELDPAVLVTVAEHEDRGDEHHHREQTRERGGRDDDRQEAARDASDRGRDLERHPEAHVGQPLTDVGAAGRGARRHHRDQGRGDRDAYVVAEPQHQGGDDHDAATDPDDGAEPAREQAETDQGQGRGEGQVGHSTNVRTFG
jgi:hypothetical protein